MKKTYKALIFSILGAAAGMVLALGFKVIRNVKLIKTADLKGTLAELFPHQEWSHTGTYVSVKSVVFSIYYPEGFLYDTPNAETLIRDALLEKSPSLANLKLIIRLQPLSDFDTKI